jgi:hypothetical protein
MGDHKANARAIINAMLPPILPPGFTFQVDVQLHVMPARDVLFMPAEKIRRNADGNVEAVLLGDDPQWQPVPEGAHVHEVGTPLPPEHADVVAILGSNVSEKHGPRMIVSGHEATPVSSRPFAVLGRAKLLDWQREHLSALRGEAAGSLVALS